MEPWLQIILTAFGSVMASSGFWAFAMKKNNCNEAKDKMILGLGHDRIVFLCMVYIDRGYITPDEYENLYNYLFVPYKGMNGNGSAERLMDEVKTLRICSHQQWKEENP